MAFSDHFKDKTLRIDYFQTSDAKSDVIAIDQIYEYGLWGRNRNDLVEPFSYGAYRVKLADSDTEEILYSRSFKSYCFEYKSTQPAIEGIARTFHQTAIVPSPKREVKLIVERRDKKKNFNAVFSTLINPSSIEVVKRRPQKQDVKVIPVQETGPSEKRVDIAILGDGYAKQDRDKFIADTKRITDALFESEPFRSRRDRFNVYGIYKASLDSGITEPHAGIYRDTTLSSSFNALGIERYMLPEDNKSLMDLAESVSADTIYVMANHNAYGGGGIYNQYCVFSADAKSYKYLVTHELGHSFGGLNDEYYTRSVTYVDLIRRDVEPAAPNVTALLDPKSLKWKDLLTEGIKVPTRWKKDEFDAFEEKWQKGQAERYSKVAELKSQKASQEKIAEAEKDYLEKDAFHMQELDSLLRSDENWGKVGAFEGAGYADKGLYRPMLDCVMFTKGSIDRERPFCRVCEAALIEMIDHYCS